MKTAKKVFAALVALVMVLAMGTFTALAASDYSITITNTSNTVSIVDNTYSAYKIFDVTYNETTGAYSYTADSDFTGFTYTVDGTTYSMDTTENTKTLISYLETLKDNSDEINAFATAVWNYIDQNDIPADASDTAKSETLTIELDEAGYYLVYCTGTANEDDTETVVSAVMLDTTDPDAEINLKADAPTINKVIVENKGEADEYDTTFTSEEVGESVDFKITSTIPTTVTGYTAYTYIINDTMSKGLTYDDGSMAIVIVDENGDTVYTYDMTQVNYIVDDTTATDGSTAITIDLSDFLATAKEYAGYSVVVTYSATVDEDAYDATQAETNTVYLEYSNDPYTVSSTADTPEVTVYVADFDIEIFKYYVKEAVTEEGTGTVIEEATNVALEGAKFVLQNAEDKYYTYTETNGVVWVDSIDDADVVTSDDEGFGQFCGLAAGTYTLVETVAPEGYNLADPIEVVITLKGIDGTNGVTATATVGNDEASVEIDNSKTADQDTDNQLGVTVGVLNTTGTKLPSTGGIGTYIFYTVGGMLMIAALGMFVSKRKGAAYAEEA